MTDDAMREFTSRLFGQARQPEAPDKRPAEIPDCPEGNVVPREGNNPVPLYPLTGTEMGDFVYNLFNNGTPQ